MKISTVLPFVSLGAAFVIPDERVLSELAIEDRKPVQESTWSKQIKNTFEDVSSQAKASLADAFDQAIEAGQAVSSNIYDTAFDAQSWLESAVESSYDAFEGHEHPHPPHHGPPDHDRPHHPPPHHGPHHDHRPNATVYELISTSKYTTKLAKLINDYPDLVEALNGTKANYTVFAPTDAAFEKIPEHHHKPSKEDLKKILSYHVSPDFYPAKEVLKTHTIPTLLNGEDLPGKDNPQRLSVQLGLKGLTLNFYSRVVGANFFGTNGVIHAVDHIILPPPEITKIIALLPSEFSTLELALAKTGLNTTQHPPGTLFAPSNFAFSRLGARINAFLFSPRGLPYLEALLKYHIVPKRALYSDAYYKPESDDEESLNGGGVFHIDLPTLLDDRSLSIDIAKYFGFIEIKINSFARVSIFDGVAKNGVIQVVSSVLVPPKKLDGVANKLDFWNGSDELTLEDFVERLEPFVAKKFEL